MQKELKIQFPVGTARVLSAGLVGTRPRLDLLQISESPSSPGVFASSNSPEALKCGSPDFLFL